jgi:hypothetical protein
VVQALTSAIETRYIPPVSGIPTVPRRIRAMGKCRCVGGPSLRGQGRPIALPGLHQRGDVNERLVRLRHESRACSRVVPPLDRSCCRARRAVTVFPPEARRVTEVAPASRSTVGNPAVTAPQPSVPPFEADYLLSRHVKNYVGRSRH